MLCTLEQMVILVGLILSKKNNPYIKKGALKLPFFISLFLILSLPDPAEILRYVDSPPSQTRLEIFQHVP